ncbi:hypothetical protein DL93DRAFT_2101251 [Clavulina sp. PMI_390]|nr:hypothetical protein DL93DRAFT_2101251 [Clavulina sp. PMI_390]
MYFGASRGSEEVTFSDGLLSLLQVEGGRGYQAPGFLNDSTIPRQAILNQNLSPSAANDQCRANSRFKLKRSGGKIAARYPLSVPYGKSNVSGGSSRSGAILSEIWEELEWRLGKHELVYDILDDFTHEEDSSQLSPVCSDALRNCALVCASWRYPAQKRLFRHVNLTAPPPGTSPTRKPILRRFKALLAVLQNEHSLSSSQPTLLAQCVHTFTLLEAPSFQDPALSPHIRVSPKDFATILSLLPNLRTLHIKSGVLQLDRQTLRLLNGHSAGGAHATTSEMAHRYKTQQENQDGSAVRTSAFAPASAAATTPSVLARVTHFSIVQERTAHRRSVEQFLSTRGLLPALQSLSWTCFDGVFPDEHLASLVPVPPEVVNRQSDIDGNNSSTSTSSEEDQMFPSVFSFPAALASLTLDFRASGPSLGLLCALLRSSMHADSLRAIHLPSLPQALPPHALELVQNSYAELYKVNEHEAAPVPLSAQEAGVVTSLSDVLRRLPSIETLTLGSPGMDTAQGMRHLASQVPQTGGLDLSVVAPQAHTLVCTAYPLEGLLMGESESEGQTLGRPAPTLLSTSTSASLASMLSDSSSAASLLSPPSGSSPPHAQNTLHQVSRLPPSLKRLEVRLTERTARSSPYVWTRVVDSVEKALGVACEQAYPGSWRRKEKAVGLESIVFELPASLSPSTSEVVGADSDLVSDRHVASPSPPRSPIGSVPISSSTSSHSRSRSDPGPAPTIAADPKSTSPTAVNVQAPLPAPVIPITNAARDRAEFERRFEGLRTYCETLGVCLEMETQ